MIEDETKPPARYTQHGLVALMKSEGIGRPSTYAATIKKLFPISLVLKINIAKIKAI